MVGVVADPGVDHPDGAVPIPRLDLNENPVRQHALVHRVDALGGTDIPVLVEIAAFRLRIGVLLIEFAQFQRMADKKRRILSDRKILVGQFPQRHPVRLHDIKSIVFKLIAGILQTHFNQLGHFKDRIGNVLVAHDTAILFNVLHVVNIARMNAVLFAGMRKGERQIALARTLPRIDPARTAAAVIDVEPRRRRNVLRMGPPKTLFETAGLPGHKIGQMRKRLLDIKITHPSRSEQVGIERLGETEVAVLRTKEIVERHGGGAQVAQVGRAHVVLEVRILVLETDQRSVHVDDIDIVSLEVHVPRETLPGADRIVEKIGFQRLADLGRFFGGIGLLFGGVVVLYPADAAVLHLVLILVIKSGKSPVLIAVLVRSNRPLRRCDTNVQNKNRPE